MLEVKVLEGRGVVPIQTAQRGGGEEEILLTAYNK